MIEESCVFYGIEKCIKLIVVYWNWYSWKFLSQNSRSRVLRIGFEEAFLSFAIFSEKRGKWDYSRLSIFILQISSIWLTFLSELREQVDRSCMNLRIGKNMVKLVRFRWLLHGEKDQVYRVIFSFVLITQHKSKQASNGEYTRSVLLPAWHYLCRMIFWVKYLATASGGRAKLLL